MISEAFRKPLRTLVGIVSYGERNLEYLRRIIRNYRGMPMDVDVVVFSESAKDLQSQAKVVVGLPSRDPWSLPFAHKRVFAENVEKYDLFIYSEDDIEVTERNILAFLRVSSLIRQEEVAGFLRYETDQSGKKFLPDVHKFYRWRVDSASRLGGEYFAEFSNEHSAFYLLNRGQLKRAILSGGYLRPPYQGRYDMICSAGTDPYTSCGMRKVICLSALDDFLVHHLSNRYAGQVGLSYSSVMEQVEVLKAIAEGRHPATVLCETESRIGQGEWSKNCSEQANGWLLEAVPRGARSVLSIGCGLGMTESKRSDGGTRVTVLPLDSVIGATLERRGIEVVYANLKDGLRELEGRRFECILIDQLLHLLEEPVVTISRCRQLLEDGGMLIAAGPNFEYLPVLMRRLRGSRDYGKLKSYQLGGVNSFSVSRLVKWLREAGFTRTVVRWHSMPPRKSLSGSVAKMPLRRRAVDASWRLIQAAVTTSETSLPRGASPTWGSGRFFAEEWLVQAWA